MYENEMIVPEVEEDEEIEIDYSHKKPKEFRLKDVCEPSQLSEKMLTENDEIIRRKDIPERFQVKGSGYVPDDAEAAKEASFISRLLARDHPDVSEKEMEKSVKQVLKFLRRDNLEIPFIFAHRKDYFDKILYLYDLWKIVELDEKFTKAEQKKKQLLSLIEKISAFNPAVNSSKINDMVNRIMSLDDAEDVSNYININFANENSSGRQRRQKKAAWKAVFDDARKHRIPDFAQLYGIDFENYAISVTTQQASHFPDDYSQPPEQAASNFVSSRFPTPESVLEAVIVLISHQLASLPFLRTFIRRVYFTDAVVSVILTDSGAKDIVSTHPFYHFKYLTNKPIHKFNDGQFLQIIQAENDGLLTISIKVEEEVRLLEDMTKFICNDNMSELASLWNEQRKKIALRAAKDILFPHALNWMKKVLSEKASDYISARCQIALEKRINMSPFKPLIEDTYDDESPSVIAISWGEGSKSGATIAVALDENGAMAEFIKLDRLNDRERSNDVDRLISFVKSNQPQVIVCSGLKPNTKSELLKILKDEVIGEGVRSKKIDAHIPVLIIDDDAARIYMNSKRGLAEFPDKDYHPLIRYCVSLGRKVQDPTMEYAGLFNVEEDYKSLRLHPLQNYLSETNLKAAVERAFLNVVALWYYSI
jgi:transcription elongation factor SPT6